MTPAEHTIDRQRLMIRALEQENTRLKREIAELQLKVSADACAFALAKAAPLHRAIGR